MLICITLAQTGFALAEDEKKPLPGNPQKVINPAFPQPPFQPLQMKQANGPLETASFIPTLQKALEESLNTALRELESKMSSYSAAAARLAEKRGAIYKQEAVYGRKKFELLKQMPELKELVQKCDKELKNVIAIIPTGNSEAFSKAVDVYVQLIKEILGEKKALSKSLWVFVDGYVVSAMELLQSHRDFHTAFEENGEAYGAYLAASRNFYYLQIAVESLTIADNETVQDYAIESRPNAKGYAAIDKGSSKAAQAGGWRPLVIALADNSGDVDRYMIKGKDEAWHIFDKSFRYARSVRDGRRD